MVSVRWCSSYRTPRELPRLATGDVRAGAGVTMYIFVKFLALCLCFHIHDLILVLSGSVECSNHLHRGISEHQIPLNELVQHLKHNCPCLRHERLRIFAVASSLKLRGGYSPSSEEMNEGIDQNGPKMGLGSGTLDAGVADELKHARSKNRPALDEEEVSEPGGLAREKTSLDSKDMEDSRRTRRRRRREKARSEHEEESEAEEVEEDEEDEDSDKEAAEEERLAQVRAKEDEEDDDDDDEDYGLEGSEVARSRSADPSTPAALRAARPASIRGIASFGAA